jgi:hypothetical protein
VSYSGVYVLDLVATCSEPNALPTPLQRRSYTATLSQRGHEVTMTLSGADFVLSERWANGNVVQGFVAAAAAMFRFEEPGIGMCTPMSWNSCPTAQSS